MHSQNMTRRPSFATAFFVRNERNIQEMATLMEGCGYAVKLVRDGRALLFSSDTVPVTLVRINDVVVEDNYRFYVMNEDDVNYLYITSEDRTDIIEDRAEALGVSEDSLESFVDTLADADSW